MEDFQDGEEWKVELGECDRGVMDKVDKVLSKMVQVQSPLYALFCQVLNPFFLFEGKRWATKQIAPKYALCKCHFSMSQTPSSFVSELA